jgi:xylulokinase
MSFILGIDLGTSSIKGLLVSMTGEVINISTSQYPVLNPQIGFSEQDPQSWVDGAKDVLRQIILAVPQAKTEIKAISFSGQMHSLIVLDENDHPLRNAILWNDARTTAQCRQIEKILGSDLIAITKNMALEGFTLPKILWIKEHEPEIFNKIRTMLLPKDYLGFWFTGNKQMEYSDAAGTLLLDIANRTWSKKIADAFNIPQSILPKLVNSTDQIGFLRQEIAKEFGIQNKIPIYAGGADNPCGAVGAAILDEKTGLVSIGTSGVFLSYEGSSVKNYEGRLHFFNHVIKDCFYSMGVELCAGNSLSWLKDNFAKNLSFEDMLKDVGNIPAGAGKGGGNDLLFSPYLIGERTPYADSKIRGSFIGIDISYNLTNFARAVMEGITFGIKDSMGLMIKYAGKKFDKIISVGGGAKNKTWLQMQADIFDTQILTLTNEQGPAMGAVMIAAVGAGIFETFQECARVMVGFGTSYKPNSVEVEKYKLIYEKYGRIYTATKGF